MKICIIGAGIVGCSTAWQLASQGHEVVLLDAEDGPARATSRANGAQLSYSYVEPLASPATLRAVPKMLLSPRSPLTFRLRPDWRQWQWGLMFLAACTPAQSRRGTLELLRLAQLSRDTLEGWLDSEGWPCAFARNGKLVLCPDAASLGHQARQVAFQAAHGCRQDVLDARACLEREPALADYAGHFAGGIWTADECVADPARLAQAMADALQTRGAQLRFGTRVTDWQRSGDRVVAVRTAAGEEIAADLFVLAAGAQAAALATPLGLTLPVYPVKGYSLTLAFAPGQAGPAVSVTDLSRKTVFAPLEVEGRPALRVAAMAEIVGYGLDIPDSRVERMLESVEAVFPGRIDPAQDRHPWAGLRPATPTSVPLVGRAPRWDNLYLNVGHGALGLTLAAGSAAVLGRQIAGRQDGA